MVAVFRWLRKNAQADEPLTGGPARMRVKTYSAASGYVYQYVFIGQRPRREAMEYVFDASWDRREWRRIPVIVTDLALSAWISRNGRELTSSERYAVAKIALRNAFDQRDAPAADAVHPDSAEVTGILDELGV